MNVRLKNFKTVLCISLFCCTMPILADNQAKQQLSKKLQAKPKLLQKLNELLPVCIETQHVLDTVKSTMLTPSNRYALEAYLRMKEIVLPWWGINTLKNVLLRGLPSTQKYLQYVLSLTSDNEHFLLSKKEAVRNLAMMHTTNAVLAYGGVALYTQWKSEYEQRYEEQKVLLQVQKGLKALEEINQLLVGHDDIKALLPNFVEITAFTAYKKAPDTIISPNLKHFYELVMSSSFTGDSSYYRSFKGKIQETYQWLQFFKDDLQNLFNVVTPLEQNN